MTIHIDWQALRVAAERGAQAAYAPYSKFHVGAALLASDGRVFVGCNVENASFGLSICAERNAVFSAVTASAREFSALALITSAATPVTPCGACRQVLFEFPPSFPIRCFGRDGSELDTDSRALLPHAFVSDDFQTP